MYVMEGSSTNTLSVRRTYILLQTGGDNIMLSYAYIILYGIIILYTIHTEAVTRALHTPLCTGYDAFRGPLNPRRSHLSACVLF